MSRVQHAPHPTLSLLRFVNFDYLQIYPPTSYYKIVVRSVHSLMYNLCLDEIKRIVSLGHPYVNPVRNCGLSKSYRSVVIGGSDFDSLSFWTGLTYYTPVAVNCSIILNLPCITSSVNTKLF